MLADWMPSGRYVVCRKNGTRSYVVADPCGHAVRTLFVSDRPDLVKVYAFWRSTGGRDTVDL